MKRFLFRPSERITLEAVTLHAAGQQIQWIRNAQVQRTDTVPADGRVAISVDARSGDWFSVIVKDASGPTTFTNAIFVGALPSP